MIVPETQGRHTDLMRTPLLRRSVLGARWPLALLGVAILLTIVAIYESIRVGVSNQRAAERVVHDYAEFAAWAFEQHLEQKLGEMAREVLSPVNHGEGVHESPRIPPAADLAHYIRFDTRCGCHRPMLGPVPEAFLGFSIKSDTLGLGVNTHPQPLEGWEVDRPLAVPVPAGAFTRYTQSDVDTIVRSILRMAHERPDHEHGYTWLTISLSVGPRAIAYTLMPTAAGDTLIYGAQYSALAMSSVFQSIIEQHDLLPASISEGSDTRHFIGIEVRDRLGQRMFASGMENVARDLQAESALPARFANLSVSASIAADKASSLIVGGLPSSHLPFLLGVLLVAGALTVGAVALLRRETELAHVRAEWIASVSHELRTPLAQIRLFLDTVRLGRAPTEDRRAWALTQMDRETTRLNHLVEKVLSFSRLGRATDPGTQPADIGVEAQRIVDEFRPIAETRKATLVTDIGAVPTIALQHDTLRHILLNLLDNAVKYGPPGQTITVRVAHSDDAITLSVEDQGPGVPAAEREAVWRPFARGKTSSEQGGSGIGLSIVRDLASKHGGRATVSSAPKGGALFLVTLPVHPRAS